MNFTATIKKGYDECMKNHTCGNYLDMSDIDGLEYSDIEWYYNDTQLIAFTEFGTYHYDYDADFNFDKNLEGFVEGLREFLIRQVV